MTTPYATLSPDAVVDCIESVGYRCDLRLLALNSYENRVYQVGIEDDTPIIAKFYRAGRWSDEQILNEHRLAQTLVDHELSVVAPLAINGQTLHTHDGHRFGLFPRQGGHPPELDNFDHLLSLGRTLARIHRIGASLALDNRPSLSIDRMVVDSREYVLEHFVPNDLRGAYESLALDCERAIRELLSTHSAADDQIVHGDCHTGNILWRDDTPHFVDLDDCCHAPVIQDLWMFLSGDRSQKELQLAELISGYEEFNDFDPAQLRWIEALRTMRIMHYAAWLGRRWDDPAFPAAFPWFGQDRFWADHILELREQLAAMQEPPLRLL